MNQNSGNNTSDNFLNLVEFAKDIIEKNNNLSNKPLSTCIAVIKKSDGITRVLNNELILLYNFDINIYRSNENKIENRAILCNTALEEYQLFITNKEQYLEKTYKRNMFNPKEIDINKDTLFEQSVKKLIVSLGSEKNSSAVQSSQLFELYELRQNKLKEICKEFTQKRQIFLSRYIKL